MNEINRMFAGSVTTKSAHPGYSVLYRDRQGGEHVDGPYSLPIAKLAASEIKGCVPFLAIRDEQTAEIWII